MKRYSILNNKKEIWKDIKGYEGAYQISNFGRIKSFQGSDKYHKRKEIILSKGIRNTYEIIQLSKNKTRKSFQVHRLVAEAFLPNPHNYPIVNHKDFNRLNNNVDNLEWCTQKHNVNYSKINMIGKVHIIGDREHYGIIYRKKQNNYEVTIKQKYYGKFKTFEDAKRKRDEVLNELNIAI